MGESRDASPFEGTDLAALDRSARPCDDFYEFACGGWIKSTPIPEDEAIFTRSFQAIEAKNESALRAILERLSTPGGATPPGEEKQLGDLYASCMDEEGIEQQGLAGLAAERALIDGVKDASSLALALALLHDAGVPALFAFDAQIDVGETKEVIGILAQAGLGLPDREAYAGASAVLTRYEEHVAKMLALSGEGQADAWSSARTAVDIERSLARASMTGAALREPRRIYHRLEAKELRALAPAFPWDLYLRARRVPLDAAINVAQPDYLRAASSLIATLPMRAWRAYLQWHLLRATAPMLPAKFVAKDFEFHRTLVGTQHLAPRWKRCVRAVDAAMGDALAQPFVRSSRAAESRRDVRGMVSAIASAMRARVDGIDWMDRATRERAGEKLAALRQKIGFPDSWRSYEGLEIDRGPYVANRLRAARFESARRLSKIGKMIQRDEWQISPTSVNAYYQPSLNEIVIPAGILQPPLFVALTPAALTSSSSPRDARAPAASFGGIGMIIGHELTHALDDEGRQYDARGQLADWWSDAAVSEFQRRASCVEEQFNAYEVAGVRVNGHLTLGENLADLGGLELAYAAFKESRAKSGEDAASGEFTADQHFFIGFAQAWCASLRPEAMRLRLATNPHAPPRFRVIGPLSNMPEFAAAFRCARGSPMVREDRCEIW